MVKRCVIVTGMHCSGTSAMAGFLHTNGVMMGSQENFIPRPSPENPRGFYENFLFRSLNDAILAENGYYVKSFSPAVPTKLKISERTADMMDQLLWEYNKHFSLWGFKDPRTCLTFKVWKNAIDKIAGIELITIVMRRNPADIAFSMQRRGNVGTSSQFANLAKAYYECLDAQCKPTVAFKFESLVSKTDYVAAKLGRILGIRKMNTDFIIRR